MVLQSYKPPDNHQVQEYVSISNSKSDLERTAQGGSKAQKTGVPTGSYAIHPITGKSCHTCSVD